MYIHPRSSVVRWLSLFLFAFIRTGEHSRQSFHQWSNVLLNLSSYPPAIYAVRSMVTGREQALPLPYKLQ